MRECFGIFELNHQQRLVVVMEEEIGIPIRTAPSRDTAMPQGCELRGTHKRTSFFRTLHLRDHDPVHAQRQRTTHERGIQRAQSHQDR